MVFQKIIVYIFLFKNSALEITTCFPYAQWHILLQVTASVYANDTHLYNRKLKNKNFFFFLHLGLKLGALHII